MCLLSLTQSCTGTAVEVARVASPDGKLDAIVIERDVNATTSFWYDLRIVEHGKKISDGVNVASLYGARRNDQAYGVNAKWEKPTGVTFEYWEAEETRVTSTNVNVAGEEVTIRLRPGILDPSAPRGGMAYNLNKR